MGGQEQKGDKNIAGIIADLYPKQTLVDLDIARVAEALKKTDKKADSRPVNLPKNRVSAPSRSKFDTVTDYAMLALTAARDDGLKDARLDEFNRFLKIADGLQSFKDRNMTLFSKTSDSTPPGALSPLDRLRILNIGALLAYCKTMDQAVSFFADTEYLVAAQSAADILKIVKAPQVLLHYQGLSLRGFLEMEQLDQSLIPRALQFLIGVRNVGRLGLVPKIMEENHPSVLDQHEDTFKIAVAEMAYCNDLSMVASNYSSEGFVAEPTTPEGLSSETARLLLNRMKEIRSLLGETLFTPSSPVFPNFRSIAAVALTEDREYVADSVLLACNLTTSGTVRSAYGACSELIGNGINPSFYGLVATGIEGYAERAFTGAQILTDKRFKKIFTDQVEIVDREIITYESIGNKLLDIATKGDARSFVLSPNQMRALDIASLVRPQAASVEIKNSKYRRQEDGEDDEIEKERIPLSADFHFKYRVDNENLVLSIYLDVANTTFNWNMLKDSTEEPTDWRLRGVRSVSVMVDSALDILMRQVDRANLLKQPAAVIPGFRIREVRSRFWPTELVTDPRGNNRPSKEIKPAVKNQLLIDTETRHAILAAFRNPLDRGYFQQTMKDARKSGHIAIKTLTTEDGCPDVYGRFRFKGTSPNGNRGIVRLERKQNVERKVVGNGIKEWRVVDAGPRGVIYARNKGLGIVDAD